MPEKMKKSKTLILGFGFFGISLIWTLYNMYVPVFLKDTFHLPYFLIGSVMTIDNVLAVLLLPFLGALSDRTVSRLGKRRPYILFASPFAMVFFIMIPFFTLLQKLALLLGTICLMNLSMAIFRSPVIALMPDITPSPKRSLANGIINFMGGLGALLVFFGGKPLYDTDIRLPFVIFGGLMLLACLIVVIFINEDRPAVNPHNTEHSGTKFIKKSFSELWENLKDVFKGEKSLLWVLLGIFFWFTGYNAIETFFSNYAKQYLGLKESTGGLILGVYSLMFMLTAILAGMIGQKIGRRLTIRLGLFGLIVVLGTASFFKSFWLVAVLFGLAGFCWSLVNVNSLPMVVDMTDQAKVGGYTGLYYFFSQAANIVSPPLAGWIIDFFTSNGEKKSGYPVLFYFALVFFGLAVLLMFFVKRGEVQSEPIKEQA